MNFQLIRILLKNDQIHLFPILSNSTEMSKNESDRVAKKPLGCHCAFNVRRKVNSGGGFSVRGVLQGVEMYHRGISEIKFCGGGLPENKCQREWRPRKLNSRGEG